MSAAAVGNRCDLAKSPTDMTAWCVYMLHCADNTLYTGVTTDIDRRIREHNGSPRGARYTRHRRPVTLAWLEHADSRSEACRRERQVRHLARSRKNALIAEFAGSTRD